MLAKKILPVVLCFLMFFTFINTSVAQNKGVSKKELKEYETLIDKCYDNDGNPLEVSKADAERIDVIYANMSEKQKHKLEKKNLLPVTPEEIGTAKGIKKTNSLLPLDASYFIDKEAVTPEEALKTIESNRFKMVRKKTDDGYAFHITLL